MTTSSAFDFLFINLKEHLDFMVMAMMRNLEFVFANKCISEYSVIPLRNKMWQ